MSLADKRTPPHMLSGPEQKKARSSWKGNAESDTSSGNRRHGSVTEDVKNTLESKLQKFKFLSRALGLAKKPLEEKTPKVDKLSTSLPGQQKDSDAAAAIMGRTKNTPIIIIEDEETNPSTPVSESVEISCAHNQSLREEGYGNAAEPWIDGGASEETSCARNEREEGYGDAAETRIDGGACHGEELVAESSLPGLQKDSDAAAVIIGRTKTMPIIIIEDEEINHSAHPSESAIDHQMKESGGTSCAQNQSLREEGYGGAAGTRIDGGACYGRELVAETLADINKASRDMEISDDDTPCGRETEENEGKEQILPVDDDGNRHASSAMEDDDTPCGQETEDNKGNEQIHPVDDDGNQHASGDMVISDDDTPCGRETEDNEGNEQILPVDYDVNQHGETEVEYEDEVGEIEEDEENGQIGNDGDGLEDIWNEMYFSLECSKDRDDTQPKEQVQVKIPDCDHCFVLKEDLGSVCRVCGVIEKGIQDIIEYQYQKRTKSSRTYYREAGVSTDKEAHELINRGSSSSVLDMPIEGLAIHPMHRKQMKTHQLEGFNFLLNNLVSDNPGGCILAHAPGSGKTFMIISFMQSFLAKYPEAKPLVVLPKGILSSWKKEFTRWQVENIPLYDFYSAKADSRAQQLEVLKQWTGHRSILFLGYMQLSSIICDDESNETTAACQKILLEYPSILILDEGHTPRNEETDVLASLKKVQTPRKVVLSGTLYQNHVKEVFNIFDLVRPKFLKQENSRAIMRRILSRVPHARKQGEANNIFYESVETTLQKEDFKRKITVIRDLREMTSKVLHFYKGDFLDELPGLEDFTVFLNLSPKQKAGVNELKKLTQRFKIISEGSALYVHPELRKHLNTSTKKEKEGLDFGKMDAVIEKSEIRDGVKANFFLNLLGLCETTQEKLLVFSQYIQPLKFLERLVVKKKNWSVGKEIFVITGDSSSDSRDSSMEQFNNSSSAKLFFGSIKACGEGISLVGGSRIIILDVHLNPSVTRQAIGRAFRPGQEKKVYTYRLVAADSPEEDDHATCYRKESISKMWFEWNECCRENEFEMQPMDVKDCGDEFLESPMLCSDVKSLYKR